MATYFCRLYPQHGGYTVLFPDFPGCITEGDSLKEAISMAEEALAFHIKCLKEQGDDIPDPRPLELVVGDGKDEDGEPFVAFGIEHKSTALKRKRININIREDHLDEIDKAAEEAGMTRSGFLVLCAQAKIQNDSDISQQESKKKK